MRKPKSPCMVAGKLCAEHAVGCKAGCERWAAYEQEYARYKTLTDSAKSKEADVTNFQTKTIQKTKKKLKIR